MQLIQEVLGILNLSHLASRMAGRCKVLMILLVLCLARFGRSQMAATIIGQNFCNNLQGINDNLSCPDDPIEGQACFTRDNLCNGVSLCPGQEDEGSDATLSSLECRHLRVLGEVSSIISGW